LGERCQRAISLLLQTRLAHCPGRCFGVFRSVHPGERAFTILLYHRERCRCPAGPLKTLHSTIYATAPKRIVDVFLGGAPCDAAPFASVICIHSEKQQRARYHAEDRANQKDAPDRHHAAAHTVDFLGSKDATMTILTCRLILWRHRRRHGALGAEPLSSWGRASERTSAALPPVKGSARRGSLRCAPKEEGTPCRVDAAIGKLDHTPAGRQRRRNSVQRETESPRLYGCAEGQNRTAYAGLFRAALYR
jgi:hypothetical protein